MKKLYTTIALMVAISLGAMAQVNVTYTVDITEYLAGGATLGANGIRIGGNFTDRGASNPNWTPSAMENGLTNVSGNIWSITITYPSTSIDSVQQFKFVNNDWGTNEGAATLTECGVDDGNGGFNRVLTIPASDAVFTATWNECGELTVLSVNSFESTANLNVFPNPSNGIANLSYSLTKAGNTSVEVINTLGEKVMVENYGFQNAGTYNYTIGAENLAKGIYIVRLTSGANFATRTIAIQ